MLRKIFLSLTALLVLSINVCAENISYDFTQNKINNTGSYSIVKKGEELYFLGEKDFVDISLEKGDEITLLRWNSYANIKPEADPAVYNVCDVIYRCEGEEVQRGTGLYGGELIYPEVDEKNGYDIKWSVSKSGENELTANAEYVLKDYTVTFKADGKTVSSTTYNIHNTTVTEPAVPKKDYYNGKWEDYDLTYGDIEINAVYTPIDYTVTFEKEGTVVAKKSFNIDKMEVEEPTVPEKEGYTGKWEDYTLSLSNITVKALYEVIEYEVKFVSDEETVKTEKYTVENKKITEPAVPPKDGYTGRWKKYELNLSDITVEAEYTPIEYKAIFKAENFEEIKIFTVENYESIEEPPVPEKTGYTGEWESYKLSFSDITVNADYKPNKYKITFNVSDEEIEVTYDDKYPVLPEPENTDISKYFIGWYNGDEIIAEGNKVKVTENVCLVAKWGNKPVYTVTYKNYYQDGTAMTASVIEGEKLAVPEVPEKTGYIFQGWYKDAYGNNLYDFETSATGEITLHPKWDLVRYTVTFKEDGNVVTTRTYTIENPKIVNPSEPKTKEGYTGKWESYTLTYGNVEVNAVYTPISYYIHFVSEDGLPVAQKTYTVEDKYIEEPEVPEKTGYLGVWQSYELTGKAIQEVYPSYTLINYKVTFVAEGEIISQQSYTVTNKRVTAPAVRQKEGYTAAWESYSLNLEDITVKAIYTPIEYKVTFVAEGKTVAEESYTVENNVVYNPDIPAKTGYTAKWQDYSLNLSDITVEAVYTPINYTVVFIADGKEISVQSYNIENMSITKPTVPEKTGYTAKWEDYSLNLENINVKAVYEVIEYTAIFKINGEIVSEQKFNVENMKVTEPNIPAKTGYRAKWEAYNLTLDNITINAVYEIINYSIVFKAEGEIISTQTYNVENMIITEPDVPEKTGYTAKWQSYSLNLKNITVNAVYTPIEYTVKFVVAGVEISSSSYTVENKDIIFPEVPEQEWKVGKWEEHTLETGDVTINAVYTFATYIASFKADGNDVMTVSYDFNNQNIEQSTEIIPKKTGYRAVWERYEVVPGGMTVNARYIPKATDDENAEELYHYQNLVTDLSKLSETGTEREIIENIISVGKGILADIQYGIIIEEEYIKSTYNGIIKSTQSLNSTLTEREKTDLSRLIATAFKEEASYDYFRVFYDKYF